MRRPQRRRGAPAGRLMAVRFMAVRPEPSVAANHCRTALAHTRHPLRRGHRETQRPRDSVLRRALPSPPPDLPVRVKDKPRPRAPRQGRAPPRRARLAAVRREAAPGRPTDARRATARPGGLRAGGGGPCGRGRAEFSRQGRRAFAARRRGHLASLLLQSMVCLRRRPEQRVRAGVPWQRAC